MSLISDLKFIVKLSEKCLIKFRLEGPAALEEVLSLILQSLVQKVSVKKWGSSVTQTNNFAMSHPFQLDLGRVCNPFDSQMSYRHQTEE